MKVEKVTVLGAGVMGHGIAQLTATVGFKVTIRDIEQSFLDGARKGIEGSLSKLVQRGRMTEKDSQEVLNRITMVLDLAEAVKEADLIVEAVPEKMSIKHQVWGEVSRSAKRDAILATNTSSLSITEMAKVVDAPERFVGMHFFNPPVLMQLVEVIPGAKTSQETISAIKALAEKLGKTPVAIKRDSPGFIFNRVVITYLNEAAKLLDKGYTKEQIDAAMQYKVGMPMGPFMLSDLIGLDIVYNILRVLEESLGPYYTPAEPVKNLYEGKKLGRKTGEGFYSYAERPAVTEDQAKSFDVNLLLRPFVAEAEKLVAEGVADIQSIDNVIKLGGNIPFGPFELKARMEKGETEEKPVLVDTANGVFKITLNRPSKANGITSEMLDMIAEAVDKAEADKSVRCIVVTGAGDRAFSSGADIDRLSKFTGPEALGGGCEVAMWCDYRIASDKARFGQTEINLGIIPGWGATKLLSQLIGVQKAKELMMGGELIGAQEALAIGLVNKVVPAAEFGSKVDELVKKLVNGPPIVLAALKRLTTLSLDELEAESKEFGMFFYTADLKEGVAAFKEKRKPVFKGQ
jgi:enoyl-CoA hydratase/3-hydroxyacyl-CoA dehydrogenase